MTWSTQVLWQSSCFVRKILFIAVKRQQSRALSLALWKYWLEDFQSLNCCTHSDRYMKGRQRSVTVFGGNRQQNKRGCDVACQDFYEFAAPNACIYLAFFLRNKTGSCCLCWLYFRFRPADVKCNNLKYCRIVLTCPETKDESIRLENFMTSLSNK